MNGDSTNDLEIVRSQKKACIITFAALVYSVPVYVLFAYLTVRSRQTMPPPTQAVGQVVGLVGLACLVVAVWLCRARLQAIIDRAQVGFTGGAAESVKTFQSATILTLAVSAGCTIVGLLLVFLGSSVVKLMPFALGTMSVDVLFILPRIVAFFSVVERSLGAVSASDSAGKRRP